MLTTIILVLFHCVYWSKAELPGTIIIMKKKTIEQKQQKQTKHSVQFYYMGKKLCYVCQNHIGCHPSLTLW